MGRQRVVRAFYNVHNGVWILMHSMDVSVLHLDSAVKSQDLSLAWDICLVGAIGDAFGVRLQHDSLHRAPLLKLGMSLAALLYHCVATHHAVLDIDPM